MFANVTVYYKHTSAPFKLSHVDGSTRLFRKELIHVGEFIAQSDGKPDFQFGVNEKTLHHWAATHQQFRKNGITVPLPLEHSFNPEKNRGEVLEMDVAKNDDGVLALFGTVEFADEEAEKLASTSDVSIFVPPEWTDGKGNTYVRPIRHVALTDYPTIPGLDKFEAIAASLAKKGVKEMAIHLETLQSLATAMGVEIADGATPETIQAAILRAFKAGATTSASLTDEVKKLKEKIEASTKKPDDDKKKSGDDKDIMPKSIAASIVPIMVDSRGMKIDKLVDDRAIVPAVAEKLKAQFCDTDKLVLLLSADGSANDGFDGVIDSLKDNDPVKLNEEKTGKQTMKLSNINDPKQNALLADAEQRVEDAKAVTA